MLIFFGNSSVIFQVIRGDPWHDKYVIHMDQKMKVFFSALASWKVIFLSLSHASSNPLMTDFQIIHFEQKLKNVQKFKHQVHIIF